MDHEALGIVELLLFFESCVQVTRTGYGERGERRRREESFEDDRQYVTDAIIQSPIEIEICLGTGGFKNGDENKG